MIRKIAFALAFSLACAAPALADEPDGLTLPPGFHAQVVATGLTGLRHIAVRDDHTLYASTRGGGGRGGANPGVLVLHLDADHKADRIDHFSTITGGTGIRIQGNWLYASSNAEVYRVALKKGEDVPSAAPQVLVTGMPTNGFSNRILVLDGKGNLFVSVGGSGNICTAPAGRGAKPKGLHPCPGVTDRGGVWKFSAGKLNQKFPADGVQIATGLRDSVSLDYRRGDALYLFMHDRADTHATWPDIFSEQDEDNLAEELHRLPGGKTMVNMGWPYTYYDSARKARFMAPEYGGDNKVSPPPGLYADPVLVFHPSHSAPLDMLFYYGRQFPRSYRGGAFVARHGGQGPDTPQGHNGYDVVFIPFTGNGKAGAPVTFAAGFAGPSPAMKSTAKAAYRPTGLATGPDGALYVTDSQKGRIWRISYDGK
jgi:glucose/arabinose dehydrogenase